MCAEGHLIKNHINIAFTYIGNELIREDSLIKLLLKVNSREIRAL